MAAPEPSDAALLADRATPDESFSLFYRRHVRGILAFCAHRGLSAHDAADVTSEVFVAALTQRYRFDPAISDTAEPWLFGIARNVANSKTRRSDRERSAHERLRLHVPTVSPDDVIEYAELRSDVDRALAMIADLPPDQRAAVIGRHLEDSTYVELAELHGVSEDVIRQRVSRGLASLRARLGQR